VTQRKLAPTVSMAEDLTKGLHILLQPKFQELFARLDRVDHQYKELSEAVASKEERDEVEHLRGHFEKQIAQVDSVIGIVKDKMINLDELRTREIRTLSRAIDHKATVTSLQHVVEQVHAVNVGISTKADLSKVEQLTKQLGTLSEDVSTKVPNSRTEELGTQIQHLSKLVSQKVNNEQADAINERIKVLTADALQKAASTRVEEIAGQLRELAQDNAHKAESHHVEQLHHHIKTLKEEVARGLKMAGWSM